MDKFGKKLNNIWEEIRNLPEGIGKVTSEALTKVAQSISDNAKAQTETKAVLDRLLITAENDDKQRTIQGSVSIEKLYEEIDKALKANTPTDHFHELTKMVDILSGDIKASKTEVDYKAIAQALKDVLPEVPSEFKLSDKIEVFGKTLTKLDGNDAKHPIYVEVVNAADLKGSGSVSVSQGGSIPDDLIESDGAGGRQLKVSTAGGVGGGLTNTELRATPVPVSGTVTATSPTSSNFKAQIHGLAANGSASSSQNPVLVAGSDGVSQRNIKTGADGTVIVNGSGVTQPVSGTVAVTGVATAANQLPNNHNVVVTSAPTTAVTGAFYQATQPVSAASLPLPSGAATSSAQTTAQTSLNTVTTDLDYRYAGGKQSKVLTTSAGGDLDAITPAAGKFVRVFWVAFVPNSDNGNANLVKLGFGTAGGAIATELYRGFALAHWEVFDGAVNQSVIINTATAEAVAVTIHYQEI